MGTSDQNKPAKTSVSFGRHRHEVCSIVSCSVYLHPGKECQEGNLTVNRYDRIQKSPVWYMFLLGGAVRNVWSRYNSWCKLILWCPLGSLIFGPFPCIPHCSLLFLDVQFYILYQLTLLPPFICTSSCTSISSIITSQIISFLTCKSVQKGSTHHY